MELTEKRLAANRLNALKSTGPKTEHGKRVSSRNSTRHGILAKTVLVSNEDSERFADLLNSFYADFQPQNETQRGLIEKMAVSHWRVKRVWAAEAAGIILETRRQADSTRDEDPPTRTLLALRAINDADRHADSIGRREIRYDRAYYNALETLLQLQNNVGATRTHLNQAASTRPEIVEPTTTPVEPTIEPVEPTQEPIEPAA